MIDKRFYEEHCNQRLMTDLREQVHGEGGYCHGLLMTDHENSYGHSRYYFAYWSRVFVQILPSCMFDLCLTFRSSRHVGLTFV